MIETLISLRQEARELEPGDDRDVSSVVSALMMCNRTIHRHHVDEG